MSNRRELLSGIAGLAAVGGSAGLVSAAMEPDLDDPATNLAMYIKLRGDLAPRPVHDLVQGRVYGLVQGEAPRPLFKTLGAQLTRYERISPLEYAARSRYLGLLLDWQTGQALNRWINPYNDAVCEVPQTRYGPSDMLVRPDGLVPAAAPAQALPAAVRPWTVMGGVLHMTDEVFSPAVPAALPDGDLMAFSGEWSLVTDPALTRVPSRLSFTAVEHWRDWMALDQPGSLWWHVAGVKLTGWEELPARAAKTLRQADPGFFRKDEL